MTGKRPLHAELKATARARVKIGRIALTAVMIMAIATALLALVFSGCKGGKPKPAAGLAAITATSANGGSVGERAVSSVEGPGGTTFHFEPLDGDDSPDRKGVEAYELSVEENGDEVHLIIRANASAQYDWKYVLGYVYYDAESYNPVKYVPGDMFGEEDKAGEEFVTTAIFKVKGKAAFWHGLLNWDEKDSAHGGLVGTFVFKKEPWNPGRDASVAPNDGYPQHGSNKVDDITNYLVKEGENEVPYIRWSEVNRGDGDLNGEVGIADQTPIAQHLYTQSGSYVYWIPPFYEVFDYHHDLVINLNDIQVIVDYYGVAVGGYQIQVYQSQGGGLILDTEIAGPSPSQRNTIKSLAYGPYYGFGDWYHSATGQVGFKFTDVELDEYEEVYVRVRPFDQDQNHNYGVWSELTKVVLVINQPPTALLETSSQKVKCGIPVLFDASDSFDRDGTIVKYEWDLDGNDTFEQDTGSTSIAYHTYASEGTFYPKVRVTDNLSESAVSHPPLTITAVSYLNEIGFRDSTPTELVVNNSPPTVTYSVAVRFRDISHLMSALDRVRLDFSGDTNSIHFATIPQVSTDVKVWNNNDSDTDSWGDPRSGFFDEWNPPPGGQLIKSSLYNDFSSVDIFIAYFQPPPEPPQPPPPPSYIQAGASGVAFEFRFTVNLPHGDIAVDFGFGSEYSCYFSPTTRVFFDEWSDYDTCEEGFTEVHIPARQD